MSVYLEIAKKKMPVHEEDIFTHPREMGYRLQMFGEKLLKRDIAHGTVRGYTKSQKNMEDYYHYWVYYGKHEGLFDKRYRHRDRFMYLDKELFERLGFTQKDRVNPNYLRPVTKEVEKAKEAKDERN